MSVDGKGPDHRAIADPPEPRIASDPMEATAELDRGAAGQLSLSGRLRQPRTIISILIPLVIIAIFAAINGSQLTRVPGLIAGADLRLVAVAFVIFYSGFPLRGLRWAMLLRGTGIKVSTRDSTEIIFLSWLVNCVVPAKLGDVYRAYLLKINSSASLSRTFGTVFIERVLDLIAIALLGIAAGFWSFRDGLPQPIQVVFAIGLVVVAVLSVGLFTMRNFGRRILMALPFPPRLLELYDRFEEGVFGAIALRQLPFLGGLTVSIWMTEALRLFFVVQALGFADVELGLSGAVFVALIGSLLTAVPLSPAGLGIVEAGVVGVLTVAYGVPLAEATAIALLDRVISVFSIIVLGSVGYLVSSKPRGLDAIARTTESTPA
ncbi:MAG: glycosyltransferase 2 family protein [Chloroflexota bacterium]|nr:glycosyltransferase 2 family protein [Chloroflexota bacterium]